jgi:hypothetical protein
MGCGFFNSYLQTGVNNKHLIYSGILNLKGSKVLKVLKGKNFLWSRFHQSNFSGVALLKGNDYEQP